MFDDAAPQPYAVPSLGSHPRPGIAGIGGSFRPTIDALSIFAGLPIGSSWTVEVRDAAQGFTGTLNTVIVDIAAAEPPTRYANCDGVAVYPFINIEDYICFLSRLAAGDPYANCDGSTTPPVLNVNDFICFLAAAAAGCSVP